MSNYFACPNCGADVPINAKACPECGSDDETGWSEEANYVHLLPDRGDVTMTSPKRKYLMGAIALGLVVCILIVQGLPLTYILPVVLGVGLLYYFTSDATKQNNAYQRLLTKAKGDNDLVNRLIKYEQNRTPEATRLQNIENAISRWERDRRV